MLKISIHSNDLLGFYSNG